jgi:hypothetical protein
MSSGRAHHMAQICLLLAAIRASLEPEISVIRPHHSSRTVLGLCVWGCSHVLCRINHLTARRPDGRSSCSSKDTCYRQLSTMGQSR